jgi:acyl carrier protein
MLSFQNLNELKKRTPQKEKAPATKEENNAVVSLNYVAPETELEKNLCELWLSFLPGKPGATDNFFELGGNSLKAMTLLKRIQKEYNVQLTLKDFYAKPTVKLLAQEINIATLIKNQKNTKERSTLKI